MPLARLLRIVRALVRIDLAIFVEYRATVVIWMLAGFLPLMMMVVWRHIAETEAVGGFDAAGFARYFLLVFLVQQSQQVWVIWNIDYQLRTGTLAIGLLRPYDPLISEVVENVTANVFRLPLVLVVVIAGLIATGALGGFIWAQLPLFLLAVVGGWAVKFNMHYCLALLGLWTERARSFDGWFYLAASALGGGLFPLALMPEGIKRVVALTPFPLLVAFPIDLATRPLGISDILLGFAIQAGWTLLFFTLHRMLWRQGIKHFGATGG